MVQEICLDTAKRGIHSVKNCWHGQMGSGILAGNLNHSTYTSASGTPYTSINTHSLTSYACNRLFCSQMCYMSDAQTCSHLTDLLLISSGIGLLKFSEMLIQTLRHIIRTPNTSYIKKNPINTTTVNCTSSWEC